MISDRVDKFPPETLEVQSNNTNELTEFDSILKAITGKRPFTKELHDFTLREVESILQSIQGLLKYSSFAIILHT